MSPNNSANKSNLSASTSIPSINSFQLDENAIGRIKNSVNLFRGEVNLPLDLMQLPGRNGLDVTVSALYQSNVQQSVDTWNEKAPTGILGLGWSIPLEMIVVDNKNTGSNIDNTYYLMVGGIGNPLVKIKEVNSNEWLYQAKQHKFWKICYHPEDEYWEVTKENGITYIYGQRPNSKQRKAPVQYGVHWGNWIGSSAENTIDQKQFISAWNLTELSTLWGDLVTMDYCNEDYSLGQSGPSYTQASYLKKITDVEGRTIIFDYLDKDPNEYQAPHEQQASSRAYQDHFETKFLNCIQSHNQDGNPLFRIQFGYKLLNFSTYQHSDPLYPKLTKRCLTSITNQYTGLTSLSDDCDTTSNPEPSTDDETIPSLLFDYYENSTDCHPGALKSITYPEGGTAQYTYEQEPLVDTKNDMTIEQFPCAGTGTPRVWFGTDYVVITWYDDNLEQLKVCVYTWVGHWVSSGVADTISSVKMDIDTLTVTPTDYFFVLNFTNIINQSSPNEHVIFFRKHQGQIGNWDPQTYILPLNSDDTPTSVTVGDNFSVVCNVSFNNSVVNRYTWNWSTGSWLSDTPGLPSPDQIALTGQNNFYLICSYNNQNKSGQFQISYLDAQGRWQQGDQWQLNFDVYILEENKNLWTQTFWSLGDTFAVGTSIKSVDQSAETLTYEMRIFQWNQSYQISNHQPTPYSYTVSIPLQSGILPTAVRYSLIGNAQHLLRFNGSQWSSFDFNIGNETADDPPEEPPALFVYGSDVAIMSDSSGGENNNQYVTYDPRTKKWNSTQSLDPSGHQPTISGNYFTIGSNIYYYDTDGSWQRLNTTFPASMNPKSLSNRGPEYMVFEEGEDTEAVSWIVLLQNGRVGSMAQLPSPAQRVFVPDDNLKGKILTGPGMFVTYPSSQEFDQAKTLTLYRIINQSAFGPQNAYRVRSLTIDAGMPNEKNISTSYRYDDATASYDPYSRMCQYYKVTEVPGIADPTSPTNPFRRDQSYKSTPFGYTEHYFFNGLSADNPHVHYPIGPDTNAAMYYSSLNGEELSTCHYDADGNEISSTLNYWYVYDTIDKTDGTKGVKIPGIYARLKKQDSILDGVPQTILNDYDLCTGLISSMRTTNVTTDGKEEIIDREMLYWWQIYDKEQNQHLLAPIIQTTLKRNGLITSVEATRWKDWDRGGGTSAPAAYQTYILKNKPDPSSFDGFQDWNGDKPDTLKDWLLTVEVKNRISTGTIQESANVDGASMSILYGNSKAADGRDKIYEVASFANASLEGQEAFYYGFEDYETNQGWKVFPDTKHLNTYISENDAHAGIKCLKLPGDPSVQVGLPCQPQDQNRKYILSCWLRTDPSFSEQDQADWKIDFENNGNQLPSLNYPISGTGGEWIYWMKIIDLPQYRSSHNIPDGILLHLTLLVCNAASGKNIYLDDIRFSPLKGGFTANIYDSVFGHTIATLGNNGETVQNVFDILQRKIAVIGPDGIPSELTTHYYSRQYNDIFTGTDPNSMLLVRCRGKGLYTNFRQGVWQNNWTATNPSANWEVDNGLLIHKVQQYDTLTLKDYDKASDYGVRVKISPQSTLTQPLGINIGQQITVQWKPGSGWQLIDHRTGNSYPPLVDWTEPLGATEWVLFTVDSVILFYANGQQIFAHKFLENAVGAIQFFTSDEASFQDIIILGDPIISVAFSDGASREKQTQVFDGSGSIAAEILYDELGRQAVKTRAAPYPNILLSFQPDFVKSMDWEGTGVMTGDVATYYSDDNGYPYARTLFDTLGRPKETGSPGEIFAINPQVSPADRHTLKYKYLGEAGSDNLASDDVPQYFKEQLTDEENIPSYNINDKLNSILTRGSVVNEDKPDNILKTKYEYDDYGNMTCIHSPSTEVSSNTIGDITISYDFLRNVVEVTRPDSGTTKYMYDPAGRLRFSMDAKGANQNPNIIQYWKYDLMGRIVEKGTYKFNWGDGTELESHAADQSWPNSTTWRKKYIYDEDPTSPDKPYLVGRLAQALIKNEDNAEGTEADVLEDFAYNINGGVIQKGLTVKSFDETRNLIAYEYNRLGNIMSITYQPPENQNDSPLLKVYYSYNRLGQVISVGNSPDAPDYYASYSYNGDGSIHTETLNNAPGKNPVSLTRMYNPAGWVSEIGNSKEKFSESIRYIPDHQNAVGYYNGQIAQLTYAFNWESAPSGYDYQYQYDGLGRIVMAVNKQEEQWSIGNPVEYDDNGNVTSLKRGNESEIYHYKDGTNKIETLKTEDGNNNNTYSYDFDENGYLTNDGRLNLNLNYDSFTQMPTDINLSGNNPKTVKFRYGGYNRRVLKTVQVDQKTDNKLYVHGMNNYPLIEKTDNGKPYSLYVYGPTGLIAFQKDQIYFVVKDHEGSTRVVLDTSGNVIGAYNYLPFGNLMGSPTGSNPSVIDYLYTGQEFDSETGLYNFRARLYDGSLRRFYQPDPANQFINPYFYTLDDPIALVDKNGRFIGLLIAIGIGILLGAIAGGVGYYIQHHGEDFNARDFWISIGIGAISGAVAGATGYGVAAALGVAASAVGLGSAAQGVIGGIVIGAVSGSAASVTGQVVANALTGNDLTEGLWQAAVIGGVTGGVIGGISAGVARYYGSRPSGATNPDQLELIQSMQRMVRNTEGDGYVRYKDVMKLIPKGTQDTWRPGAPPRPVRGFKYEFNDADGGAWVIRGHEADGIAPLASNSRAGWTLQVEGPRGYTPGVANRPIRLMQYGSFKTPRSINFYNTQINPLNEAHIPLLIK